MTTKLTKQQEYAIHRVYEDFSLAGISGKTKVSLPGTLVRQLIHAAVVYGVEGERERLADRLASIIATYPHGLNALKALEDRLRRCEP